MERYLSTGKVARICQVSAMTIAKWIDEGALPGHTTPGGHRRVAPSDLVLFLERLGMRVPPTLLQPTRFRILAIDGDPHYLGRLADTLFAAPDRYVYRGTVRGLDALVIVGEWKPQVVLLDLGLPDVDAVQICRRLSAKAGYDTRIVGLARQMDSRAAQAALRAGAAAIVRKVELPGRLLDLLEDLLSDAKGAATAAASNYSGLVRTNSRGSDGRAPSPRQRSGPNPTAKGGR